MAAGLLRERGIEARYRPHPGRDPRKWAELAQPLWQADVLYLISSRVDRWSPQALLARVWRRRIVIHWVGTDVLFALEAHRAGKADHRLVRRAHHIVDAPWLADELSEMGIDAPYAPLPVPGISREAPSPLPPTFRVLFYYPLDPLERENFDFDSIMRLVQEFPDVAFRLVPSPAETLGVPAPANLETSGWVDDLDSVYRDSSVYIRLTEHDGTSFMAVEALSRARYVIWTHPMAGAIHARDYDEVARALQDLLERHQRGELTPNEAGRAAVLEHFDTSAVLTRLISHLLPGRA